MTPAPTAPDSRCVATVLFGHGSRDPLWRKPMDAVAARMAELEPGHPVVCAFLELAQPDLPAAVAQLVDAGERHIRVLPLFLGVGKHAREDLPLIAAAIRAQHPDLQLEVLPAVGDHAALIDLLADIALDRS